MNDFLKKQKRFKALRNFFIILAAIIIFVYIGVEPFLIEAYGDVLAFQLSMFALVIVAMTFLFLYEAKYSKAARFLEDISFEINDAGYYFTSRPEKVNEDYLAAVKADLENMGYKTNTDVDINELKFELSANKGNEFFYMVCLDEADKADIIAYTDSARFDVISNRMKRKGSALVVFLCSKASEDAVSLSKAVTRTYVGKNVISFGVAIVELETKRVYFRGNEPSILQKLCANFVMNCDLPLDNKYVGNEKLEFQYKLEDELKTFNLKAFNDGKYFER